MVGGRGENVAKLPRKRNMKDEARGTTCWEDGEGVRKNEKEFQISGVRDWGVQGNPRGNKLHQQWNVMNEIGNAM